MGGLLEKILKKLKGAKFSSPCLLIVLAKHIGRGAIAFCKYFCKTGTLSSFGLRVNMFMVLVIEESGVWKADSLLF